MTHATTTIISQGKVQDVIRADQDIEVVEVVHHHIARKVIHDTIEAVEADRPATVHDIIVAEADHLDITVHDTWTTTIDLIDPKNCRI